MLPYNECATHPWRHLLDARLLAEVLGITDTETHEAMQELREKLCAEPSIAGTKERPCSFAKDRKKAEKEGWAYDYDEALEEQMLATQQLQLASVGIWLPA